MHEPTGEYHNGNNSTTKKRGAFELDNNTRQDKNGINSGQPSSSSSLDDEEVYLLDHYKFRQSYGYLSYLFGIVQIGVLATMMWQCGVAPFQINPMIGPYPDVMSYWGAKNAYLILEEGEKWRLLTPILLHAGVLHLVGNVHVQMDLGAFWEKEWGSTAWLIVYLTSAVGSSILSTYALPDSISVGSSGAVMGLFGAKLSEIFCRCCDRRESFQERIAHEVRKQQICPVLGGVTMVMLFSFIPYVDWAAHLGGLLSGMAVGLLIFPLYIQNISWRLLWRVLCHLTGIITTILYFSISLRYMYSGVEPMEDLSDLCEYYKQFFEDYECNCVLQQQGSGDSGSQD